MFEEKLLKKLFVGKNDYKEVGVGKNMRIYLTFKNSFITVPHIRIKLRVIEDMTIIYNNTINSFTSSYNLFFKAY